MSNVTETDPRPTKSGRNGDYGDYPDRSVRRLSTETKQAFKQLSFGSMRRLLRPFWWRPSSSVRLPTTLTIFRADKAWLYVVVLTVGYMISRGIAKAGSRDHYDERR